MGHIALLAFAEDSALNPSALVSGNPCRIGGSMTLNGTGLFALARSGKRLQYSRNANTPQLRMTTAVACKTFYCDGMPPSTTPTGALALLSAGQADDSGYTDGTPFLVGSGSSNWFTSGGWVHSKNGTADEVVGFGSGPFVYSAKKAGNAMTNATYGCWFSGYPCFPFGGAVILGLDNIPSAEIDARNVAAIRKYCGY